MAYKDKSKKTAYQNEFIKSAYDRINLTLPKGRKTELQAAAERHGQSVNGLINSLIDEVLERERAGGVPAGSPVSEDGPGVVMVSAEGSPDSDICSRLPSLTTPDFQAAVSSSGLTAEEFIDKAVAGQVKQWAMSQVPAWLKALFPDKDCPATYIMRDMPRYEQRQLMKDWTPAQKEEFDRVLKREITEQNAKGRANGAGLFAKRTTCNLPLD